MPFVSTKRRRQQQSSNTIWACATFRKDGRLITFRARSTRTEFCTHRRLCIVLGRHSDPKKTGRLCYIENVNCRLNWIWLIEWFPGSRLCPLDLFFRHSKQAVWSQHTLQANPLLLLDISRKDKRWAKFRASVPPTSPPSHPTRYKSDLASWRKSTIRTSKKMIHRWVSPLC